MTDKFNREIEHRVLQNLMLLETGNKLQAKEAFIKLANDCFYTPLCLKLFALIKKCFISEQGFGFVEILTLVPRDDIDLHQELEWIIEESNKFPINLRVLDSDIDKLLAYASIRRQYRIAQEIMQAIESENDIKSLQNDLIEKISELNQSSALESKAGVWNEELISDFLEGKIENETILPTTWEQLNECLGGGIRAKSLIFLAAGSGIGKTGFSIFLMDAIARNQPDRISLFYSLEMESKHISMRHTGICAGKRIEEMDPDEYRNVLPKCLEVPFKIFDVQNCKNSANIDFICTNSRIEAMKKPISVIIVDYLGLVDSSTKHEQNHLRLSEVTTKLARLAIELDCVVICLSQINRESANRDKSDRCPYPSDAAESSGGHRSATLWIGLDRPETYRDDPEVRNQFVVKCRKNRFGNNFELYLAFNQGTFQEVPLGYFRQPYAKSNSFKESLFG